MIQSDYIGFNGHTPPMAISPNTFNNQYVSHRIHHKNASSLGSLIDPQLQRRFSESGVHKKKSLLSMRSGSENIVIINNDIDNDISTRHASYNTAAFHSKSRK